MPGEGTRRSPKSLASGPMSRQHTATRFAVVGLRLCFETTICAHKRDSSKSPVSSFVVLKIESRLQSSGLLLFQYRSPVPSALCFSRMLSLLLPFPASWQYNKTLPHLVPLSRLKTFQTRQGWGSRCLKQLNQVWLFSQLRQEMSLFSSILSCPCSNGGLKMGSRTLWCKPSRIYLLFYFHFSTLLFYSSSNPNQFISLS